MEEEIPLADAAIEKEPQAIVADELPTEENPPAAEAPPVEDAPAQPDIVALMKERLEVEDPVAFVEQMAKAKADYLAAQEQQAQAQTQEQQQAQVEATLKERTADYLAQLQQAVVEGLPEAEARERFTQRWHLEAAKLEAETVRAELAALKAEGGLSAIQAEFPRAAIDELREMQAQGITGSALKMVAQRLHDARAGAQEAQERAALSAQAAAHRPGAWHGGPASSAARGPQAPGAPRELDWADVRRLSVRECMELDDQLP